LAGFLLEEKKKLINRKFYKILINKVLAREILEGCVIRIGQTGKQ
jgi:hypothetical protein